jgi:hypothetical protein
MAFIAIILKGVKMTNKLKNVPALMELEKYDF